MARSIAVGQSLTLGVKWMSPRCRVVNHRRQSSSSSSCSESDPLIRKLEEAIQRIMVRRSAPDWLPFLPGASYWVPPPPPHPSDALAHMLHNLANPITTPPPQSPMSVSLPVWPSSSYFIQGAAPHPHPHPYPHPLELDSHSQDEEDDKAED